jgi:hypothetical protein
MEPEDLLRAGENEPKAGANELRAIVARAQRRRWRVGVAGLAAALAIGGGVGYALSNHHSSGQSVATSPESGSKAGSSSPAGQSGPAAGSGRSSSSSSTGAASSAALYPERLQPLFTRTAGSVDVRGFLLSSSIKLPQGYAMPSCAITGPRFEAEVSTTKMVGTVVAGYAAPDPAQTLSDVSASIVGVAEGDPILVVTADAGKGVAQVKVTGFAGGGTDSMAPVGGWVALAGPTTTTSPSTISPVKVGTISALSGSGQVLASESVTPPTVFGGGPLPLSSAAGAQAANGASVVCEGAGTGSGPIAPGQGTFHVICPPSSVPGTVLPAASTGTGGGVPSNGGSAGSASASAACSVRVEPASTGSSSTGSSSTGSSSSGSSSSGSSSSGSSSSGSSSSGSSSAAAG